MCTKIWEQFCAVMGKESQLSKVHRALKGVEGGIALYWPHLKKLL